MNKLSCLAALPLLAAASLTTQPLFAQASTHLVSHALAGATDGICQFPSISADGRFVAYSSQADNIVPNDTNSGQDVFLVDVAAGTTTRLSVSSGGVQGNGNSNMPRISADGRLVVFQSTAENLVAGDTNNEQDIFLRDVQAGTTTCVSVNSSGVLSNGWSAFPAISPDGRYVSFSSVASNLQSGSTGWFQVYVRDLQAGTTVRASVSSAGLTGNFGDSERSGFSADGRFVVFDSSATNLVAADNNLCRDVFLRDMLAGTTVRINLTQNGFQATQDSAIFNGHSISDSGSRVAFRSAANNLVDGDTNQEDDVFVRDIPSGEIRRVSHGPGQVQGNGWSDAPSISGDGRFVIFASAASNLVDGDTNGLPDVFVYDWRTDALLRVSVSTSGVQANGENMSYADLSGDGRYSVFASRATNLDPTDPSTIDDIYLHDRGAPLPSGFCSGDGSGTSCPCGNSGIPGKGCDNSAATGGAFLGWSGDSSISVDTLVLVSSGELPQALSVLVQGSDTTPSTPFGDGLSCLGGSVRRLLAVQASAGIATLPGPGQPSISESALLRGDLLHPGSVRFYQVFYRDAAPGFCPTPSGGSMNLSSALSVTWKS